MLRDITFDVVQGEFLTILGASGSGKSTLLRVMTGLLPASSGELYVRGEPLQGVMSNFGMVFQSPVLLPWRTALDNVLLPVEMLRKRPKDYRDRAMGLLELMGLASAATKKPAQLSGGMCQRVAICRALVHDPETLFMDEPFSALDELTRESLCDYLLNIWADSGKTVVFVTHSVNEAIYLSDRIMVLDPASAGILIGYGFAVGIGIVLAVLITYSRTLHSLISPALVVFQSAPKDALAPILLIWFGFGSLSVIVMVALLSVFPIVIQTSVGFELVDPELHELARSLRASTLRRFVKVDFPSGLPSCFAGLKVAMTLAVVGAIVGELVSTTKGLGYIIESATVQGTVALSLASLVVLSLLGLVLYQAVAVIERLAAPWRHDNQ